MKPFWRSKTLIFNGVMGTLEILEQTDLGFLPSPYNDYIPLVIVIGNMWLRLITSQKVTAK